MFNLGQLGQKIGKPILFGFFGATGCFIGALAGEVLLYFGLPPEPKEPPPPQVDVMFVLDITSSMDGEIKGVQQGIQSFASAIGARKIDGKVGLIAFRDRLEGEEAEILSFNSATFTANPEIFSSQVGRLRANGGGDAAESSLDAVALASRQAFRPEATKVIVLITDAPPKIPDRSMVSISETASLLKANNINQLHLVVQNSDLSAFSGLQINTPGEVFPLGEAASGRSGFESILPVVANKIVEQIGGVGSSKKFAQESGIQLLIVMSTWTGILAIGVCLALIMGQNLYLRRRLLTIAEGLKGSGGSLISGLIAGAAGQCLFLFIPATTMPMLLLQGYQIVGWTILGFLLGGGTSFFIPNLKLRLALVAGGIGGAIGAIGFLLIAASSGDIVGRLVGTAIVGFFIGLAIAIIEEISREAWLIVHWTPNEQTKISLGAEPIVLGSSPDARIYLRKDQGYPPSTAKIYMEQGKIIMQFDDAMKDKGMKILRHELTDGQTRQLGNIKIEVKTSK